MNVWRLLAEVAPDTTDPSSILDFILRGGATATLVGFIYLWLTGRIVTRRELDEMRIQRDQFREIVYRQMGIGRDAVDLSATRLEHEQELIELLRERGNQP